MPGTYDLLGSASVFGLATPTRVARVAPKNLSSADHMKGLFTTVTLCPTGSVRRRRSRAASCAQLAILTSHGGAACTCAAAASTGTARAAAPRRGSSSADAGGNDQPRPAAIALRWVMSSG